MKLLTDIIKKDVLYPRNDKHLHFSQHLTNDRHTVIYWNRGYPLNADQPWLNTLPLLQGNAIHNEIHSIFGSHIPEYHSEVPIHPEVLIPAHWTGTADAYLKHENEWWLVDYKTISGAGMSFLDEPKPEHIMQVSCYYHFNYWQPERVGILYLPTSVDYKRRMSEPVFYEITPLDKETLIIRVAEVEYAIFDYNEHGTLPTALKGEYVWKQNKKSKYFELMYKPHYSARYCPWQHLDDDPCGCSKDKARILGKVNYEKEFIDGDEAEVAAHLESLVAEV